MNDEAFCGPRFAGLLFVGMCVVLGLVHGCARHPRGGFLNKYDELCYTPPGPPSASCWTTDDPQALQPSQSWDQENLHRNETICPNSTYYAPGGVLTECP
jgi:hypothetical protein